MTPCKHGQQQVPPQIHDGKEAPEACGGLRRLELLQRLDYEIARHPRVDFVEFCQRVHRRMSREVAAAEQRGLPFFWDLRSQQLAEVAATAPPKRGFALSRLPQGGWLVRAEKQSFLVDPAGADIATRFWAGSEFVLLTESLDMSRRNDQLLLRMAEGDAQRPFYAHIAFHMPRLLMNDMPLISTAKVRYIRQPPLLLLPQFGRSTAPMHVLRFLSGRKSLSPTVESAGVVDTEVACELDDSAAS